MIRVGVYEAKTRLSELLRRVAGGEEIVIVRRREPVARLSPIRTAALERLHRDPFDRLLVAQTELEGLTLVTADPVFERYRIKTLAAS